MTLKGKIVCHVPRAITLFERRLRRVQNISQRLSDRC
jgi:hypothetical protein